MEKKNVLGISFGRKLGNTEVMIKEALLACEKAGHTIRFLRADDLNIHICTGCISCVVGMITGRGKGCCPLKDDFHIIDEALMESDVVCDRIGPSHDISFRKTCYEEGLAAKKDKSELPDERSFKKRVGALVTVGGAMTENWLSFSLPTMYAFTMSMGIDVIDAYKYYGAMAYEHVLGNLPVMERMKKLGEHIAEALSAEDEESRTRWRGDKQGVCAVCHNELLEVTHRGTEVECPVCGISGNLSIENREILVSFPKEQIARSRLYYAGKLEHSTEIKTCAAGPGQIPDLKEQKERYRNVGERK